MSGSKIGVSMGSRWAWSGLGRWPPSEWKTKPISPRRAIQTWPVYQWSLRSLNQNVVKWFSGVGSPIRTLGHFSASLRKVKLWQGIRIENLMTGKYLQGQSTGITLTLIVQFIFHHTGILSQPSFNASINNAEFTFECMLAIVESAFTNDLRRVWGLCDLPRIIHHGKNIFVRTGMSRLSSSRMIKWSTLLPAPLMLPRIPLKQRVRQVPRVLDLSAFFKAK